MNPVWGQVAGVVILLMMLAFIALWIWVWRPRHRRSFGELARLPMADGGVPDGPSTTGDRR